MKAYTVDVFVQSDWKTAHLGTKLFGTASAAQEYITLRTTNDTWIVCNVPQEILLGVMQMHKLALDWDWVWID